MAIKRKLKFENYKNCLETNQLEKRMIKEDKIMIKECNQLVRWKHAYGTRKDLVSEKEEIKFNNIIKRYKNY